ncbi:hypothetical protein Pst134EB_005805 [Puccinia striiformis f. sp. tritici]|nr:hypothetical protein Pst134EB_005805 [Puccinia striiformis f. sp. tritici]
MNGHSCTLEEINLLAAEQSLWVENNRNYDDALAPQDDGASNGDLPFHKANQSDPLVPGSSGSTSGNSNVEHPHPTPSLGNPLSTISERKPVPYMEVDSNETVR